MLQAFKQFLITKERLPEKNLPYYVKWVSDEDEKDTKSV